MIIALGADHGGYQLKEAIKTHLTSIGVEFIDYGSHSGERCEYPDIVLPVAEAVTSGACARALLFCGTGIGVSIVANKIKGIRAAACSDCFSAKYTRLHNDANVLCMGGRVVGAGLACEMVDLFLGSDFEGGRHSARLERIAQIEDYR